MLVLVNTDKLIHTFNKTNTVKTAEHLCSHIPLNKPKTSTGCGTNFPQLKKVIQTTVPTRLFLF